MVLGDIEYGDLVWLRVSAFNATYRISIRTEQAGVEPHREYLHWIGRLAPAPDIVSGEPLDMALIYDEAFEGLIQEVVLRTAFVTSFGFVEVSPV